MRAVQFEVESPRTLEERRAERQRRRDRKRRNRLRLWHRLAIGSGVVLILLSAGSLIAAGQGTGFVIQGHEFFIVP